MIGANAVMHRIHGWMSQTWPISKRVQTRTKFKESRNEPDSPRLEIPLISIARTSKAKLSNQ